MTPYGPLPQEELADIEGLLLRYYRKALKHRHWNGAQFRLPSGSLVYSEAVIMDGRDRVSLSPYLGPEDSSPTEDDLKWFQEILGRVVTVTSGEKGTLDEKPSWVFEVDRQTMTPEPDSP